MKPAHLSKQSGATLIISLIMLILIMLAVATGFTISNTNLRSVGNMQSRDEAIAAANMAIEQVISTNFVNAPQASSANIDLNNDGSTDYIVSMDEPYCARAVSTKLDDPPGKEKSRCSIPIEDEMGMVDCEIAGGSASPGSDYWNTDWIISATARNEISGTSTSVEVGVRILLTRQEKELLCS